jgi:hypothetical protein
MKTLGLALVFLPLSWGQKDPLNDFCRRFGQQSAVIDSRLYIDGGLVDWNPISQNPQNYTSELPPWISFPSEVSQPYLRCLACDRVVGRNRQFLALSGDPSPTGFRLYLIFH